MENNFGQVELVKDIELDGVISDSENVAVADKVPFISESIIIHDESFFVIGGGNTGEELYELAPDDLTELETNPGLATEEDTEAIAAIPMLTATSSIAFIRGTDEAGLIEGTATNEFIEGEGGDDVLAGRAGDDVLTGGAGNDTLIGGVGNDLFVIESDAGIDSFVDFIQGQDQIVLPEHLTFEQLSFNGTNIQFGDQILASVPLLETIEPTAADFTVI